MSFKRYVLFVQHSGNLLCKFDRGRYEEQFREIISNIDHRFRRCRLKIYLFLALAALLFNGAEPFVQFSREQYEKHFCEIILNLDQLFRRKCRLKIFLFLALMAIVSSRAEPSVRVW